METPERTKFTLSIPLDASSVEDAKSGDKVKIVAKDRQNKLYSQVVMLDDKKIAHAKLNFVSHPGTLQVALGPANATDTELLALQTIQFNVSARQWENKPTLEIPTVRIRPYYWHWWLRWCRTFTVRGVLRCPDGNPVPGAKVCIYDIDWLWWWSSRQLIGCDTTDASGAFEIKFRWCCGWWPWWWLRNRFWRLEPDLMNRFQSIIKLDPTLPKITDSTPQPSLALFEKIISEEYEADKFTHASLDFKRLDSLRKPLLERLPRAPELERLKIWPWWPWHPWRDCHPDIIFSATQDCQGDERTIVKESVGDTRWNIPTHLDVSLVTNEDACCVGQPDQPDGNCLVIDSVCDDAIADIGGNPPPAPGVFAATDGYRNPAAGTTWSDRPYAGVVPIYGRFGHGAYCDYYEFLWSDDDGNNWNPMPEEAAGSFHRRYWGPKLGTADPASWHLQPFKFDLMEDTLGDKHYVVESREHFEAANESLSWGVSRLWWNQTLDLLMRWKTLGLFADGRYRLRVKSWKMSGDKLDTFEYLPLCSTTDQNGLVLYLDNRAVTSGPTNANGQSCGGETVHLCTTEPDTDIVSVKIVHPDDSETEVEPCGNVPVTSSDKLVIDFIAHDPDGHLGLITLHAHWGEDGKKEIFSLGTLSSLSLDPSPVSWTSPAAQVGPSYAKAQIQGAIPPTWNGGAMRLTINDATAAFKKTCCYQLRLIARKRTIADCDDDTWTHVNISERSFMIVV